MAILPIITYPNPILQKKTKRIDDPKNPEIRRLISNMLETVTSDDSCVGLAAPQVGKSVRLCIIEFEGKRYILINPTFKSKSWRKEIMEEGCLSFPGKFIPVKRSKKVCVKAIDENGNELILKADGFLARILQHEIDHLDGILYFERKTKLRTKTKINA